MTEPTYNVKEVIELQFQTLRKDLHDIKDALKDQNIQTEKRFSQIERDIDELRIESARYKTIWGVGATVGASLVAIVANKIF